MPVFHIALFHWKHNTSRKEINTLMKEIEQLKHKCNGIIDIKCGKNFSKHSKGFTYAVIVIAKDVKSLNSYRKNEDHQKIAIAVEKLAEDGIGFDFKQ